MQFPNQQKINSHQYFQLYGNFFLYHFNLITIQTSGKWIRGHECQILGHFYRDPPAHVQSSQTLDPLYSMVPRWEETSLGVQEWTGR